MGAWGLKFDENDDAADWLAEFEDAPAWGGVESTLRLVADSDYVEAPDASAAVAALEVVAAARGRSSASLPGAIASWAASNESGVSAAREYATRVLTRIRDHSELAELWDESEDAAEWRGSLDELATRLN